MKRGYRKAFLNHSAGNPFNSFLSVAKDDALVDADVIEEIAQSRKFPFVILDVHMELEDSLKWKFFSLADDLDWILYYLLSNFKDLFRKGSREETNLSGKWNFLDNFTN